MRIPVAVAAGSGVALEAVHGLDPRLRQALLSGGYHELFPVQAAVWRELAGGLSTEHDLCLCAPTGSGKTLAYALPVLQGLAGRQLVYLRALVVLPTRDLAEQVYAVFAALCPFLGLRVGLAAAKGTLAAEAAFLGPPGGAEPACGVDILVATPGRLMAHLHGTAGFGLSQLRFLVVDETDRLLRQAYQDWLPHVVAATAPPAALPWQQAGHRPRVVKLIVSATLTQDPSKIERLALHCPRYVAMTAADHRYKLPPQLQELKLVVAAERKPLLLLALLHELNGQATIVFTASVDATHRLFLLLEAVPTLSAQVVEYSSHVDAAKRAANLAAFRSGRAKVLVASDAMTRGMDVVGIENVINFDAPVYAKTYVHRAGRTARAGRGGSVFTMLRPEDVRHFKGLLRKVDNTYVKDHKVPHALVERLQADFEEALAAMRAELANEM
ncbi:hypothetical protein WJX72_010815 [[Myrmecia] bisecta]|uniref:ATP-dependent RNA helicase n=1 Tax=[Myrmecia] bisecta TaxID=41462 RepID=A0AAW1QT87_9CHLO